ncbi:hypothetical protein [Vibrio echinoideorum]|uniref:Uncharacterized protein n=1 Tax=Vibrio echinoideorum TaxID=2100116 RepID=A0ABU9FU12_9VIBR
MELRPTRAEEQFLSLGYNRFYDLFDEVMADDFWDKDSLYRFSRVSSVFAVYAEILSYEPFQHVLKGLKVTRPSMESEIGGPMFKFIRNVLAHFPFFDTWDDVWVSRDLVNWQREGLTIDKFLKKYVGFKEVKYRFWESEKKRMTYMNINFPLEYGENRIYLKDMLSEKDGVKFCLIMMRQILNTQVESVGEKE